MRTICAAIAASVAACGGGANSGPDAAFIDGPPVDAAASTGVPSATAVAVTLASHGDPVVGATAYFQRADGTLVATLATDEQGLAWAELDAGGYVTVLQRPVDAQTRQLATFTGVQPGDRLRLEVAPTTRSSLSVTLALPAGHLYQVYSSCGDRFQIAQAQLIALTPCRDELDLVAMSQSDASVPDGMVVATALRLIDGQIVDLTAQPIAPVVAATLAYANVPGDVAFVGAYEALLSPRGRSYDVSTGAAVSGGAAAATLVMAPASADAVALAVTSEVGGLGDVGAQSVYQWPAGTAYALDVTAQRLPPFATAPVATPQGLTWSESAGALAPNVTRATLTVDRPGIPSDLTWRWQIAAAHTGASLVLPSLPDAFAPRDGDAIAISDLTTALVPGGYAAIRATAFADLASAIDPTVPGTLVIQTLAPSPF